MPAHDPTRPLAGQTAIISGAAGDIGRAIAIRLAALGADLALGDVAAMTAPDASGRRVRCDAVDVADPDAVERWVAGAEAALGLPSLVIANAAIVDVQPATEMTTASWQRQLRINLDGVFFLAQACARRLVAARRPGRIVVVGSWAADRPHAGMIAYCAAKAGARQMMRCLALELAPHGILVNEVAPGWVDAGLTGKLFQAQPGKREAAAARVPSRRLITADEVAAAVAHLCDPANVHQVGSTLTMDGGLSLQSSAG